jgi:hypothetical protein
MTQKTPFPKSPKPKAIPRCFSLRIKPLEGILLEEDSPEGLGFVLVLNLLHVNTMKLCALCFARNKCSEHEVAIAGPGILYQPRGKEVGEHGYYFSG